jgi:hypothetical protein
MMRAKASHRSSHQINESSCRPTRVLQPFQAVGPLPSSVHINIATKNATLEEIVPRSTPGRVREISVALKDGCLSTLNTGRAPHAVRAEEK